MQPIHSRESKYRPDIDGLRAIAITSVVAYHAGLSVVQGGFVGVDIFFVISGYLIGSLIYKEIRNHTFSIAKFYERRARRILPALCGILVFSYIAANLLLSSAEMSTFAETALATLTSTSNIYFCWRTGGYFFPDTNSNPLLMTWSLGVEEQFYLLFPLLMLGLSKVRWKLQLSILGIISILSLAACIYGALHSHINITFYMLPTRAWELGAGVVLATFEANRAPWKRALPQSFAHGLSILGLALMCMAIFTFNRSTLFPGYAALMPVCGTLLVIASQRGIVNRLLSWEPIVFVGLVSYSWYLWHWPMLSFARITADQNLSPQVGAVIGILSFGLAVFSYELIEQPFRKSKTPMSHLLLRYGGLVAALMLPAFAFRMTDGLPTRNQAAQRVEVASRSLSTDPCLVQEPSTHPVLQPPCVPAGTERAVALIGDSHAAMLGSALHAITQQSGYRFIELTKGYCPPLYGVAPTNADIPNFQNDCLQFNREALNYLFRDRSIQIVVIGWLWSEANFPREPNNSRNSGADFQTTATPAGEPEFERGLDSELLQLEQAGKIIYVVRDVPQLNFDPAKLMLSRVIPTRRALASLLTGSSMQYPTGIAPRLPSREYQEFSEIADRMEDKHPNVVLVDLRDRLCNAAGCRFSQGDQTLFMDRNHLSPLGAQVALAGFRFP